MVSSLKAKYNSILMQSKTIKNYLWIRIKRLWICFSFLFFYIFFTKNLKIQWNVCQFKQIWTQIGIEFEMHFTWRQTHFEMSSSALRSVQSSADYRSSVLSIKTLQLYDWKFAAKRSVDLFDWAKLESSFSKIVLKVAIEVDSIVIVEQQQCFGYQTRENN